MNREVHVQFWEGVGLRCPALLAYLKAYDTVSTARADIGRYMEWFNTHRAHSRLNGATPQQAYLALVSTLEQAA